MAAVHDKLVPEVLPDRPSDGVAGPPVIPPGGVPPGVKYAGQPGWVHGHTLVQQSLVEGMKWYEAMGKALRSRVTRGAPARTRAAQGPHAGPPELNARCQGWLKLLWAQATTQDDWSSTGRPHAWWDGMSGPPMTNFPRFHLAENTYALMVMADRTPAWREAYARIADEMVRRHITHWGAVDWLTQFGDDPARGNYPDAWRGLLPPDKFGQYNTPGWTANGTAPYGVQPDPIQADGMLFYKGWLNLTICSYAYVSGDFATWNQPWMQAGVADAAFPWTHERLVAQIHSQIAARPEGVHCENTKIWPYCMSAACLGLLFHDALTGRSDHDAAAKWLEYMKKNYCEYDSAGKIASMCTYYDPVAKWKCPGGISFGVAYYILPQDPAFAREMYDAAMARAYPTGARAMRCRAETMAKVLRSGPLPLVVGCAAAAAAVAWHAAAAAPSPAWGALLAVLVAASLWDAVKKYPWKRWQEWYADSSTASGVSSLIFALLLATEFGDTASAAKLRAQLEATSDPRQFGDGMFGWWWHLNEDWPRGQLSAQLMVSEVAGEGDWQRIFASARAGKDPRFTAPTVEGVDFPALGISQAWNDPASKTLAVATYAGSAARAGDATTFRVAQIPAAAKADVRVTRDGAVYTGWRWAAGGTIEVDTDMGAHTFSIYTGYAG